MIKPVRPAVKVSQRDGNKKSNRAQIDICRRAILFGMQMIEFHVSAVSCEPTEGLTFLGVTVHRILMMLLDFSCPSWGFFLRNRRLLLKREENHVLALTFQCLPSSQCLPFSTTSQLQCQKGIFPFHSHL